MANHYEVSTSEGTFNVKTDQHHEDQRHTDATFRQHLIQVIVNAVSGITTGIVLHHYTYKGRS